MSLPPLQGTAAGHMPVAAKEGAIAESLEADGVKKKKSKVLTWQLHNIKII